MSFGAGAGNAWARTGVLLIVPAMAITFAAWPYLPGGDQALDREVPAAAAFVVAYAAW